MFRTIGEFSGPIDEQENCLLFKLPAEIRNSIYEYVFTWDPMPIRRHRISRDDERHLRYPRHNAIFNLQRAVFSFQRMPPDLRPLQYPLSLLLTCRKINLEAVILAFQVHCFVVDIGSLFFSKAESVYSQIHNLRQFLPPPLTNAITSLAGTVTFTDTKLVSEFIAHAIHVYPKLTTLYLKVSKQRGDTGGFHPATESVYAAGNLCQEATWRYVPSWFRNSLQAVAIGRNLSWRNGHGWQAKYDELLESEAFFESKWRFHSTSLRMARGFIDLDLVDRVDGLEACACGCGKATWLKAKLVQETGREVQIQAMFTSPRQPPYQAIFGQDAAHLPRSVGGDGFGSLGAGQE